MHMYATRPDRFPPLHPVPSPQPRRRVRKRSSPNKLQPPIQQRQIHQQTHLLALALESGAKLTINALLLTAFISALVRLTPYAWQQYTKLQGIQQEVDQTEARVADLRVHFSQTFDPKQAKAIMQEQSYLVDPYQKRVIWDDKE
jgi:hypothetical protein